MDDAATWRQLASQALLNGDLALAETAYQQGRAYSHLQLLYLITGRVDKLRKLARIFSVQQNLSRCMGGISVVWFPVTFLFFVNRYR